MSGMLVARCCQFVSCSRRGAAAAARGVPGGLDYRAGATDAPCLHTIKLPWPRILATVAEICVVERLFCIQLAEVRF